MWRSLFARKRDAGWVLDLRRMQSPALTASRILSSSQVLSRSGTLMIPAPLELDWRQLYKARAELDRRWSALSQGGKHSEDKENIAAWEPRTRRMLGHTDRYVIRNRSLLY